MRLNQKLLVLRELEGRCRGHSRALSKVEIARLIREETGETISLPYLSQLERGTRTHMTNKTRLLLARFFRIHPGFLVDEAEEFREHIVTPVGAASTPLSSWLRVGAARFRHDRLVSETLERLAAHPDPRTALRLLHALLGMPRLMDRLLHTVDMKHQLQPRKG
jgi:hypothetical protein